MRWSLHSFSLLLVCPALLKDLFLFSYSFLKLCFFKLAYFFPGGLINVKIRELLFSMISIYCSCWNVKEMWFPFLQSHGIAVSLPVSDLWQPWPTPCLNLVEFFLSVTFIFLHFVFLFQNICPVFLTSL